MRSNSVTQLIARDRRKSNESGRETIREILAAGTKSQPQKPNPAADKKATAWVAFQSRVLTGKYATQ